MKMKDIYKFAMVIDLHAGFVIRKRLRFKKYIEYDCSMSISSLRHRPGVKDFMQQYINNNLPELKHKFRSDHHLQISGTKNVRIVMDHIKYLMSFNIYKERCMLSFLNGDKESAYNKMKELNSYTNNSAKKYTYKTVSLRN